MRFIKIQSLSLAVIIGLAVAAISLGLLGLTSPAVAQGQTESVNLAPRAQAQPDFVITIIFTDPFSVEIQDLSGNVIGEGDHEGKVRCNGDNCNRNTQLTFGIPLTDPFEIEYKFTSRQAFDPEAAALVVAGTGTIASRGQKERFSFTATFRDNRDGTVSVTYVASRPDASFRIPRTPGTFEIISRQ